MPLRSLTGYSSAPPLVGVTPYINIQDVKADGTSGGAFTAGAWQTRTLNTIVSNVGGYAALAANQISLAPGIYQCDITAPGYGVNDHVARLQNITTATTIASGSSGRSSGSSSHEVSRIRSYFTLTSLSILEIQHWCETTNGTDGFGRASNFVTDNEVYTVAEFWKVDGLTTPPPVGDFTVVTASPFPYINIQHQLAQNTAGGTFTSGSWQTRPMNTIVTDTGSLASVASNQIVLPAGIYYTQFLGVGHQCDRMQGRIQNVTDATTLVLGMNIFSGVTGTQEVHAVGRGRFTLGGTKTLEFQQRCQTTRSTDGYGTPNNWGTEVYATVEFWKLS